jgi:formate hydrogenlyase transcriptional activator
MATLASTMFTPRREVVTSEHQLIGSSQGMRRVLNSVRMVAPTDSAVLIQGETGTGKELIARAVHDQSPRRHEPFVTVNCAAIPSGLLESELFGHERGAYTGALNSATGRFQLAHQGTLFLDEIGDMPLELQPKLLRVLQEQEFERLGSTRTIRVDVRIVAATNRDLSTMVQERRFRADLFYRLHVFPISLPPLRERRDDIPLLVRHFVEKYADRMNKQIHSIPEDVMEALKNHSWPGNIRELQNFIERSTILTSGPVLNAPLGDLRHDLGRPAEAPAPGGKLTLADAERAHILEVLRQVDWVVGGHRGAAVRLGLPRTTLLHRMHKLGIVPEEARQNACLAGC